MEHRYGCALFGFNPWVSLVPGRSPDLTTLGCVLTFPSRSCGAVVLNPEAWSHSGATVADFNGVPFFNSDLSEYLKPLRKIK